VLTRVIVVTGLCLFGASGVAAAAPIDDSVPALRSAAVYLDPGANRHLDLAAVTAAMGAEPIKIAILPGGPGVTDVRQLPRRLSAEFPGTTVAVIAGRYFYAGSQTLCGGAAGRAATAAIAKNNARLDTDENSDLTKALTDFVTEVRNAPHCPGGTERGNRYAEDEPGGGEASGADDTSTVLPLVGGAIGLVALGVLAWVLIARRGARGRAGQDRQVAGELTARLGAEVAELPEDPDSVAAQAISEAAGRHAEADALLISATTDLQFADVRYAAIAGLIAAREARVALGREPGAPVPPLPPAPERPEPTAASTQEN
jgi:hypothetical protein